MTARRLTYIRPLWQRVPPDAKAIEAFHRDMNAYAARRGWWKRVCAWIGFFALCAVCWYAIIWGAYKATEGW